MRRSLVLAVLAVTLVGTVACVPPSTPSPCSPTGESVVLGSLHGAVELGTSGRLPATRVLRSTCGASLELEAGTVLRTPEGVVLTGLVVLRLHDADTEDLLPGVGITGGGFELTVALVHGTGEVPTEAVFDPAARLRLPEAHDATMRSLTGGTAEGDRWDGTPRPEILDTVDQVHPSSGSARGTAVGGSGPTVLQPVPAGAEGAGSGGDAPTPARVERIPLPAGADVRFVTVVNRGTAQVMGDLTGTDAEAGLQLDEVDRSHTVRIEGDDIEETAAWEATVVEEGGQRYLQLTSESRAAVTVDYRLSTDPSDAPSTRVDLGTDDGEADLGATYLGALEVLVKGCPSENRYEEFRDVTSRIRDQGGAATRDWFAAEGRDGGWTGQIRVTGFSASVRSLAAHLPPSWRYTFGPRRIVIEIPCGDPVVFATSDDGSNLHLLDADLQPLGVVGAQPNGLNDLDPTGRNSLPGIDDDGHVALVDPATLAGTSTQIPAQGVLSHPTLPILLVTRPGEIVAYDEHTLQPRWTVPVPGAPSLTSPTATTDGSRVFVRAPGEVVVLDVLRQWLAERIGLPGDGPIAVDPLQPRVAAADRAEGLVWVLGESGPPLPEPAGDPVALTWAGGAPGPAVPSHGDDTLRLIGTGGTVPVCAGPRSVSYLGDGNVVIACDESDELMHLDGWSVVASVPMPGAELVEVATRSLAVAL